MSARYIKASANELWSKCFNNTIIFKIRWPSLIVIYRYRWNFGHYFNKTIDFVMTSCYNHRLDETSSLNFKPDIVMSVIHDRACSGLDIRLDRVCGLKLKWTKPMKESKYLLELEYTYYKNEVLFCLATTSGLNRWTNKLS